MNKQNIDFKTLILSTIALAFGVWSLVHMIKRDFNFLIWSLPIIIIICAVILFIGSLEKEDEDGE